MTSTIRELTRETMRSKLAEIVFDEFAKKGFENVTVDEIVARAQISRATFFRYFKSKEEALLIAASKTRTDFGEQLRDMRPSGGESVWDLLSAVFIASVKDIDFDTDQLRSRVRLVWEMPSLHAAMFEKLFSHQAAIVDQLMAYKVDRSNAELLASISLTTFDLAWQQWARGDEPDPSVTVARLFEHVPALGTLAIPRQ